MRRSVWARTRFAGLAVVAAVLACAPSTIFAQRGDQRNEPEVRDLQLRGVHFVNIRDLERSIATTESQCKSVLWLPLCRLSRSPTLWDRHHLHEDEFRRDVLRVLVFYWRRGYREAQVDTSVTRMGEGLVRVVFDIKEGPPTVIGKIRVDYDSTLFNQRRIEKLALLHAGDPLNLVVLDTMRLGYQLALWDKGFADAQVDTIISVEAAQRRAEVTLRLTPNWPTKVGTITVRGNNKVDASTIGNSILLQKGKPFRYTDLAESQRNLYESNLFRLVVFSVPPRPDSIKNVEIEVRETQMREARTAGGFNNVDFVQADGHFTNYNTFGGARRLDVTGVVGNLGASSLSGKFPFREAQRDFLNNAAFTTPTWQVSADVRQPAWLRKPENALSLGGFAHRRAAPAVYIDRGYGGQVAFTRSLAPRASASSAYRFEVTRVEAGDVYFCVNYGVCDVTTIGSLRRHQRLSPLQLSASVDRSDIPFSPTKGYIARVDLEHASSVTVSDYRFNRLFAEASTYTHFRYPSRDPRSQVLAGNLRIGYVRPLASGPSAGGLELLHPRKRFYAGGSHSVRGFDENQLGPRILTVPPSELDSVGCSSATLATTLTCGFTISGADTVWRVSQVNGRQFTPRPTGGTSLLEASVEYRMPFGLKMEWAIFLDAARIGGSILRDTIAHTTIPLPGKTAITPGVGFRYKSPVGPIRVDMGFNPSQKERLRVVTTAPDAQGRERLVMLKEEREFTSVGTATGFWGIFNRVVLHLSIGQAY
jgi:outer membrane protein insertion porin family/translocation and assembly module TamA